MKVVWTATAKKSLREVYDYIHLDSPIAAQKVRDELIAAANQIAEYPEKYQHDEYYVSESRNIRRMFKWSYRIVYEIKENHVVILAVIHTSKAPKTDS
jgi:addiction module RelE/StbE family toxin